MGWCWFELKFHKIENWSLELGNSKLRNFSNLKAKESEVVHEVERLEIQKYRNNRERQREKQTRDKNKRKLYAIGRKYAKKVIYLTD